MASSNPCPICEKNLEGLSETEISLHVNNCIDQHASLDVPVPLEPSANIGTEPITAADQPDRSTATQPGHLESNFRATDVPTEHVSSLQHNQVPILPQRPKTATTDTFMPLASYTDDVEDPTNYRRDPHKLIAYLIPFPSPDLKSKGLDGHQLPQRFLIYTPPPPPLQAPREGEKETRAHKVQRKWENEVRQAKQSKDKLASWKGVRSRATKGIDWAMGQVKSANLEFLNRVPGEIHSSDSQSQNERDNHKTVGLEEMVLVYPSSFQASPEEVRAEFINSMMRTKSKAQRDSVIATGLLPVTAGIDLLATPVWPFGGLLEVDAVWAYASIRGAKTARSVTKRLQSTDATDGKEESTLKLTFLPSPKMEVLKAYLAARCTERDPHTFRLDTSVRIRPTESDVLEAIAWKPDDRSGAKNWEDEQWELEEVKSDLKVTLGKAAKAWDKWVKDFEKDPDKALKK